MMNFKAWFVGNEYPFIFVAHSWAYALKIALAHESMTQKLKMLERID